MSTKFFNNIETKLMDKFHGIASAMANFDIFHTVVGYFRSCGYFKLRKELGNVSEIRILVGINIDRIFRHHDPSLLFTTNSHTDETVEQFRRNVLDDIRHADYDNETEQGILHMFGNRSGVNKKYKTIFVSEIVLLYLEDSNRDYFLKEERINLYFCRKISEYYG